MTLEELANRIGGELAGDGSIAINSANTLEEAGPGQISFLANPKYIRHLDTTGASAVIVAPGVECERLALVRTNDPYHAFMQAVVLLHGHRRHPHAGIHPRAHVEPTATVGPDTIIYPGVYVGPNVRIGRDCILYPNVVIYDDCILGDRVTVHAGSVIGQDGFGYATQAGIHHKIPQVGNVIIEDDVELGANCAIDRATLGSTVIGCGTKMSNLVTIGHGSRIGPHGLLVAQVGIAGSTSIGHHITIGGQAGIAGHLKIGDNVSIGGSSGVFGDVLDGRSLLGTPASPLPRGRRAFMLIPQLPDLLERIRKLEQRLGAARPGAGNPESGSG